MESKGSDGGYYTEGGVRGLRWRVNGVMEGTMRREE